MRRICRRSWPQATAIGRRARLKATASAARVVCLQNSIVYTLLSFASSVPGSDGASFDDCVSRPIACAVAKHERSHATAAMK